MQQSRFDQWLRKKIAYQTCVYTYQVPEGEEASTEEVVGQPNGQSFKHVWKFDSESQAMAFIDKCRQQNLLFRCDVVTKDNAFARFVVKPSRSVTFLSLWLILLITFGLTLGKWLLGIILTPDFQESFKLLIEEIKKISK